MDGAVPIGEIAPSAAVDVAQPVNEQPQVAITSEPLQQQSQVATVTEQQPQQLQAPVAQTQVASEQQPPQKEAADGTAENDNGGGRKRRRSLKNVKYVQDDGSDVEEVVAAEKKRKARQLDYQVRPDAEYPELDQIVGRRINKRSGLTEYLCKFIGRSYLHLWWLTFDELELFIPEGYQKQHRVQLYDRKLRREGYQDFDDVDDLEANKVTVEKILSHRVDLRDKLDDQIEKRRQEFSFAPRFPRVTDYFLLSNADVLPERMVGIVKKLLNENGGEVFEHPVDTEEIPDYLNIILNPMDLGTIAARLARENYYIGPAAVSLFISDVRLVFANCKEFNAAESDIWLIADDLSKMFEKWIYDWVLCPSAWLKLEPALDKEADKKLLDEFREVGEDSYDLWSPWEVGCSICRKNDNSEQLLLCDRCDGEIHMYCSTPEITELPEGEWYCSQQI
uniref:Bromo domain-containing protein n=1 Tax=Globisporangium ultimum (strain ATCC 200006 / CBS 805.95 / DAOM BR144) TaxID=431595 RepID=K3W761_GLOUD